RLVDRYPGQFIFEENRFLRRKRCRIIERRDREIDCVGIFAVLKKQMRAATRGERTDPIRVYNLARFALCHDQVFARHSSPLHVRRTGASSAIDAMTIHQCRWPTLQHVSRPAANASTTDLHKIALPELIKSENHESRKGISEIEGKAARVAASGSGSRTSFN